MESSQVKKSSEDWFCFFQQSTAVASCDKQVVGILSDKRPGQLFRGRSMSSNGRDVAEDEAMLVNFEQECRTVQDNNIKVKVGW